MEVVNKAELIKNHRRIQFSLINVNKRLEEEILKLKTNLKEQQMTNTKLKSQNESLKNVEYESIRSLLAQSNLSSETLIQN
jgi:cell division protein FtsB